MSHGPQMQPTWPRTIQPWRLPTEVETPMLVPFLEGERHGHVRWVGVTHTATGYWAPKPTAALIIRWGFVAVQALIFLGRRMKPLALKCVKRPVCTKNSNAINVEGAFVNLDVHTHMRLVRSEKNKLKALCAVLM